MKFSKRSSPDEDEVKSDKVWSNGVEQNVPELEAISRDKFFIFRKRSEFKCEHFGALQELARGSVNKVTLK